MLRALAIGAVLAAPIVFFSPPAAGAAAGDPEGAASAGQGRKEPEPRPQGRGGVRQLTRVGSFARYAFVELPTTARARPSAGARRILRLGTTTYWGTSTLLLALARTAEPPSRSWTKVRLPAAPSNQVGWVRTAALSSLRAVNTWLRIDRKRFTATLMRNHRVVFRARVGVGLPRWPTPAGQFVVEQRVVPTKAGSIYGALAFGTSAHSSVLTDWPNRGQVGIHGTNEPWLLPGRVSHGCIRLHNRDIRRLDRLMPVGTPITIR